METKSPARIIALVMLLSLFSMASIFAQHNDKKSDMPQYDEMTKKSNDDLLKRYPGAKDRDVTWERGKDKYNTAFYNMDNTDYMTRYDDKGNWVETYSRRDWNEDVPETIRNSYNHNYKDMEVESYWELKDAKNKADRSHVIFYRGDNGMSKSVRIAPDGKVTPTEAYSRPKADY
ncbi:MAG: hypothetical protein HC819_14170 [Cyclobacteriaceae bacterium]|nr:hypothetical protein [Cyclobacteriaceae bacterium]